ncbi:hypothetical protein ASD04_16450 [Devosia sp. Root436]|nr:hypothetical protein ASD04_16450 [Devosia sp. Root436]
MDVRETVRGGAFRTLTDYANAITAAAAAVPDRVVGPPVELRVKGGLYADLLRANELTSA